MQTNFVLVKLILKQIINTQNAKFYFVLTMMRFADIISFGSAILTSYVKYMNVGLLVCPLYHAVIKLSVHELYYSEIYHLLS